MIIEISRQTSAVVCMDYIDTPKQELGEHCVPIGSNIVRLGAPRSTAKFDEVARRRPGIARAFLHIKIAVGPRRFDREAWHRIVRRALALIGLSSRKHIYYAGLHEKYDGQHCHILTCRIGIDGSLWLGKFERWLAIEVAADLSKEFGTYRQYGPKSIAQHHKVVLVNRMLQHDGAEMINPDMLVEQLTTCLGEGAGWRGWLHRERFVSQYQAREEIR